MSWLVNFFNRVVLLTVRAYEWARGLRHYPWSSSPPQRLFAMIANRMGGVRGAHYRAIYLFSSAVLKFRERLFLDRVNFSGTVRAPVSASTLRAIALWQKAILDVRPQVPRAHLNIRVQDAQATQIDKLMSMLLVSDCIGNINFFFNEEATLAARTSIGTVTEDGRAVPAFDLNAASAAAVDARAFSGNRSLQIFSVGGGFDPNVNAYLKLANPGALVVAVSLPETEEGFCDAALREWRPALEAFRGPVANVGFSVLNAISPAGAREAPARSAVSLARSAGLSFAETLRLAQQADIFVGRLDAFGLAALSAGRPGVYVGSTAGAEERADADQIFAATLTPAQALSRVSEVMAKVVSRPRAAVAAHKPAIHSGRGAREDQRYTLIIPTYNRPALLARLVRYLERERAPFPILILDSSRAEAMARNKESIASAQLEIHYQAYDESLNPYAKVREGLAHVATEYCSICADDDVVILPAIERCVAELERRSSLALAHGYYFNFIEQDAFDLSHIMYRGRSIEDAHPLERLRTMFSSYEAVFYGVFRTRVMRGAFQDVDKLSTVLAKELLTAALSIIAGKAARIPAFYYGRNTAESLPYSAWHPHQILAHQPQLLFSEFPVFRSLLAKAVRTTEPLPEHDNVDKTLDLIFLRYLEAFLRHDILDVMLDMSMKGEESGAIYERVWDVFVRAGHPRWPLEPLLDAQGRFAPERFGNGRPRDYSNAAHAWDGKERRYRVRYEFMFPQMQRSPFVRREALTSLLQTLNTY